MSSRLSLNFYSFLPLLCVMSSNLPVVQFCHSIQFVCRSQMKWLNDKMRGESRWGCDVTTMMKLDQNENNRKKAEGEEIKVRWWTKMRYKGLRGHDDQTERFISRMETKLSSYLYVEEEEEKMNLKHTERNWMEIKLNQKDKIQCEWEV